MGDPWDEETHAAVLDEVSSRAWLIVRRFAIEYQPSEIISALTKVSPSELDYLRRLHFVLSEEVKDLVSTAVPSLLRNPRQSSYASLQVLRNFPRGKIDWSRTLAERAATGQDPTLFAVRTSDKSTDLPENRVVVFLLDTISRFSASLLGGVASVRGSWTERVAELDLAVSRLRRHVAIKDITAPQEVSGRDLQITRSSRHYAFKLVASAFDLYAQLILGRSEDLLQNLLRERVLVPADKDSLFELWVLFRLIQEFERRNWELVALRLIGQPNRARQPVVRFRGAIGEAEIAFQGVFSDFHDLSHYKELFQSYDIDVSARRPDLTLRYNLTACTRTVIVEVKRTHDKGYITESVYKLLGYLADFESSFCPDDNPRGVLVVWGGIKRSESKLTGPIEIVTQEELAKGDLSPSWMVFGLEG